MCPECRAQCPYDAFRRRFRPSTALVSGTFAACAKLASLDTEREADSLSLDAFATFCNATASAADLGTD